MSDPNLSSLIWSVADLLRGDYKQSEYGKSELLNAIMDALDAHTVMSKQALNSPAVQSGMKDILLNHSRLWETLRERGAGQAVCKAIRCREPARTSDN